MNEMGPNEDESQGGLNLGGGDEPQGEPKPEPKPESGHDHGKSGTGFQKPQWSAWGNANQNNWNHDNSNQWNQSDQWSV